MSYGVMMRYVSLLLFTTILKILRVSQAERLQEEGV